MEALSDFLIGLGLGQWVNDHDWVWPVCEIFHFAGMAMLIGSIGIIDLRLLGVAKGLPIASVEKLVPIGIIGFAFNAITGFIFVAGNPVGGPLVYLDNLSFLIKMVLILVAGINVLVFYFAGVSRAAESVSPAGEAAMNAKIVAGVSLVLWFSVIFFGRMIMYNDTLLLALGL